MGQFLLCVAQYLLIMVVLAGVGACGGFLGVKLRKSKNAKTIAETSADTKEKGIEIILQQCDLEESRNEETTWC